VVLGNYTLTLSSFAANSSWDKYIVAFRVTDRESKEVITSEEILKRIVDKNFRILDTKDIFKLKPLNSSNLTIEYNPESGEIRCGAPITFFKAGRSYTISYRDVKNENFMEFNDEFCNQWKTRPILSVPLYDWLLEFQSIEFIPQWEGLFRIVMKYEIPRAPGTYSEEPEKSYLQSSSGEKIDINEWSNTSYGCKDVGDVTYNTGDGYGYFPTSALKVGESYKLVFANKDKISKHLFDFTPEFIKNNGLESYFKV